MLIDPLYGPFDVDTDMLLKRFREASGTSVLEVGANEEYTGNILADNGFFVTGVDLREQCYPIPPKFTRITADFIPWAKSVEGRISFDWAFSTSAIEHFGLVVYGQKEKVEDYDSQAMDWIYKLLKPGGSCYITVPYGKYFREDADWRVYNKESLKSRIIRNFQIEEQFYFLSGGCHCPDDKGIVSQEDADAYNGVPPHVTVFLKLRKKKGLGNG